MNNNFEKFIDDLYKSLPPEAHARLKEIMREQAEASGDPEQIRMVAMTDDVEKINNQIISTIGLMKHLLKEFDETNNSPVKTLENLHFYKRYLSLIDIPMRNLDAMFREFNEKWCSK